MISALCPRYQSLSFSLKERQIVQLAFSDVVINEKDILRSNKADISSDGQYAKKRNTK